MRAAFLSCLIATAALAGCAESPVEGANVDLGLPDLTTNATRVLSVITPDGGHGEPSFGVAPDGTLFANGPGGRGGAVFRSTDNGSTWERVATPVEPMPNYDPDLAVDKDGTVWFSALWIGCTSTATSRDGGATWNANPLACNAPAADRQYVIPTEKGTAYLYSHQMGTFWQMAAKTTDYGATWIPTAPVEAPDHHLLVNEGSGWGGGGFWNAATGSVFLTWTWSRADPTDPLGNGVWAPGFAVTRDGGESWTLGTAESMGGRQIGLGLVVGAADDAGNVYLAWAEEVAKGDVGVFLAASQHDGATWGAPVRVDAGNRSAAFPAITAAGDGRVAVAYYAASTLGFPDEVDDDATWNVTLAWTQDALAEAPTFERAEISGGPVKKGGICTSGAGCTGDREFLDYFQIHRLPDGRVGAIFNSMLVVEKKLVEVYAATEAPILGAPLA